MQWVRTSKVLKYMIKKNGTVLRKVLRDDSDEDQEENVSVFSENACTFSEKKNQHNCDKHCINHTTE